VTASVRVLIAIGATLAVITGVLLVLWANIAAAYAIVPFAQNEGDPITSAYGNFTARLFIVLGLSVLEALAGLAGYSLYESLPGAPKRLDTRRRVD